MYQHEKQTQYLLNLIHSGRDSGGDQRMGGDFPERLLPRCAGDDRPGQRAGPGQPAAGGPAAVDQRVFLPEKICQRLDAVGRHAGVYRLHLYGVLLLGALQPAVPGVCGHPGAERFHPAGWYAGDGSGTCARQFPEPALLGDQRVHAGDGRACFTIYG